MRVFLFFFERSDACAGGVSVMTNSSGFFFIPLHACLYSRGLSGLVLNTFDVHHQSKNAAASKEIKASDDGWLREVMSFNGKADFSVDPRKNNRI